MTDQSIAAAIPTFAVAILNPSKCHGVNHLQLRAIGRVGAEGREGDCNDSGGHCNGSERRCNHSECDCKRS